MEITTVNESERYGQALLLHQKIMASGNIVQQALVDICRDLKTMRDEKLYKDLGFESFDSYCEDKVGLKARQAYTYISTYERLGAGTIKENAELGITKLSLLSSMNPVDRAEALDSGEIAGMSVREVEELVSKSSMQAEQLSLLENEKKTLGAKIESLEGELQAALKESRELQSRPVEVAVEEPSEEYLEELKEKTRTELESDYSLRLKAKEDAIAETIKKHESEIKSLEKKQKAALEEAERSKAAAVKEAAAEANKKLKAELESFKLQNAELERKLKTADGASQTVLIYFNALQEAYNNIVTALEKLGDDEKEKFKAALKKAFNVYLERLEDTEVSGGQEK